jgi:hypothetical protein
VDALQKVATRISGDKLISAVLGALASSYADDKAQRKASVAVYRLVNDEIPPEWLRPERWTHIPVPVLRAAGIADTRVLTATRPEHQPYVPPPQKAAYVSRPDNVKRPRIGKATTLASAAQQLQEKTHD